MLTAFLCCSLLTSHDAVALTADGDFYELTYASAQATLIGNCGYTQVHGMARDAGGMLWSLAPTSAGNAKIFTIDTSNGSANTLVQVALGGTARAMAFDRDGTLLVVVRPTTPGQSDQLKRIDVGTFAVTTVGNTSLTHIEGLTVAPEGPIYAWDVGPGGSGGAGLVKLDAQSGAALDVSANVGDSDVLGLGIDEVGELIGVGRKTYRVGRADGVHAPVTGDFGIEFEALEPVVQMTSIDGAIALSPDGALTRINTSTGATLNYASVPMSGFVGFSRRNLPLEYVAARDVGATTELWEIDPGSGAATLAATVALDEVRAMDISTTGVYYLIVDGGAGADDLRYTVQDGSFVLSPNGPVLGCTAIEALAADPGGTFKMWDTQKGLLHVAFGGQNSEIVAGAPSVSGIDAADFDPFGRLFLTGNRLYQAHVPSETLTQVRSTLVGAVAGIAFLRDYVPQRPVTYCTSQTNSAGCAPFVSFNTLNVPSVTAGSGFTILALNVLGQKQGLFFYGINGRNSAPFLGGFLCVKSPIRRTPVQTSLGGLSGCTGQMQIDFNAFIAGGSDPALVAGVVIDGQWWSRDPAAPSTTNLTGAIEFGLAP